MFVNQYGVAIPNEDYLHKFCGSAVTVDHLREYGVDLLTEFVQFNPSILTEDSTKSHFAVLMTVLKNCSYWTHVYIQKGFFFLIMDTDYIREVDIRKILDKVSKPRSIEIPTNENQMINPITVLDFMAAIIYTCASLLKIAGTAAPDIRYELIKNEEWQNVLTDILMKYAIIPNRVFSLSIQKQNINVY